MGLLALGFEPQIRSMLGVNEEELTDSEINYPIFIELAEAIMKKRVPDYKNIIDSVELIFFKNAVMAELCSIICPSLARKLDIEVATIDVKWKKEKIDWSKKATEFKDMVEEMLSNITSVEVVPLVSMPDTVIVGKIGNVRDPIGGT